MLTKPLIICAATVFAACSSAERPVETDYTQFVDQYIGTDAHGHVFMGANVPFGAVQVGPNNQEDQRWDWTSGYHYSDSLVIGFSHLHLSGTGIGDLGDIMLMPVTGNPKPNVGTIADPYSGYMSKYRHNTERMAPGYYAVELERYGIDAEMTASKRAGFHRYTFPAADTSTVILTLERGMCWDTPTETYMRQVDATTLEGYRYSTGWATDQRVFFYAVFDKPIVDMVMYDSISQIAGTEATAKKLKAMLSFPTTAGEEVLVKVGISPVSIANAKLNLDTEIPDWNFDRVRDEAKEAWNQHLSRIKVETSDPVQKRAFYTAMYHTAITPALFNDVNGDYRGADGKYYKNPGYDTYTTYSLWDTYRAAHPLYTIIAPERVGDFVNNFTAIYTEQGKVPVWHLAGCETNCMVGFQSIPVMADAILKGFQGFDVQKAYEAMKDYANLDERGLKAIREVGYIPAEEESESVAKALEYAVGDWCIAQVAQKLGKTDDYEYFMKRANGYKQYFDTERQFMRGKVSEGKWREPFNPKYSTHREDDYCEGNAWQYTWLVPQDVEGLVGLFGSEDSFYKKLDSLFTIDSDLGPGASVDISGLVGQYAQGNEPGHHTPYLFSYVGKPWRTAELTRHIISTYFNDKPDGLCGNEDCGQMSAWYIFTSMGFYPVNPAGGAFVLGSPIFDKVSITLPNCKTFNVIAENGGPQNIYIQGARFNGQPYTKSFITYKDIMAGGELILFMGPEPNKEFGAAPEDRPQSKVY